jgi:hypothetical protein
VASWSERTPSHAIESLEIMDVSARNGKFELPMLVEQALEAAE